MIKKAIAALFGAFLTLTFATDGGDAKAATQRKVLGIITAVDAQAMTLSPIQGQKQCITGRIDASKTHVVIDGHPAKVADLKVTLAAKAELSLDDVWTVVTVDSTK